MKEIIEAIVQGGTVRRSVLVVEKPNVAVNARRTVSDIQ